MKIPVIYKAILLICITGPFHGLAADEQPAQRRYLNQVFDDHIRTPDIVFAEAFNSTSGKTENLTMRVFEPKGDKLEKRPLFILTPGGAFQYHEEHWMDSFGEPLAKAGYVVAINRYRLSDSIETREKYLDALAKAIADQRFAIEYFIRDAAGPDKFRVDLNNIFVGGHSAGAITSMHVAYLDPADEIDPAMARSLNAEGDIKQWDKNRFKIRGVVNLSGLLTDLDIIDKGEPALLSLHGDKDDVIATGTSDDSRAHGSRTIHEYAEKVGVNSELNIIRGAGHNDPADPVLCPECVPLVKRFMFNVLRGE